MIYVSNVMQVSGNKAHMRIVRFYFSLMQEGTVQPVTSRSGKPQYPLPPASEASGEWYSFADKPCGQTVA